MICEYDEAYSKDEAEDIGFCDKCRIPSCEKILLKTKMI